VDDLDTKILVTLDKSSFESARSIAETLRIVYLIMLLYLYDSVGLRLFHLYWVPHLLTHNLREKRKEYAKAILPFLDAAQRDSWYHLMTGDESWFCLKTLSRRV
jgi:hypothetical protein